MEIPFYNNIYEQLTYYCLLYSYFYSSILIFTRLRPPTSFEIVPRAAPYGQTQTSEKKIQQTEEIPW